jgi:hypothetical protein
MSLKSKTRRNLAVAGAIAGGVAAAGIANPALADVTYLLNNANTNISGYTGPYGQAVVHLIDSTDATVTFTSFTQGSDEYYFMDGSSADVNVNATSWLLGPITGDAKGDGTHTTYTNAGSKNPVDGRGDFNQTIDTFDGGNPNFVSTTISFTLTNTGGTWASDGNVLAANSLGNFVAAHIGVCDLVANSQGCSAEYTTQSITSLLNTGYAGGDAGTATLTTSVPEASTWAMMALGFAGLGFAAFRRLRKGDISMVSV